MINFYKFMRKFFIRQYNRFILGQMKIGTHDGRFHCDEVLACTMLRNHTQKFKNATIIRTRDQKLLDQCHVVVDVGGKYEPLRLLDHHQIEFQNTYPGYNIRLSSAGLVYLHHEEIIPNIVADILKNQKDKLTFEPIVNQQTIKIIRQKIYKDFIMYIDANDNGIDKIQQKSVSSVPTTLWARVAKLNPMWWDQTTNQFQQFKKAMILAQEQLYTQVRSVLLGGMQTKGIVKIAFDKRKQIHPSGKIVLLQKYVPWVKPIFQLEQEQKCPGQILFVVFPEKSGKKWRIQAVPSNQGSFDLRKGLKQEWRGIKDQEKLKSISGIEDIDFAHASGFIGGAISYKSTIKMGQLSL